MVTEFLLHIWGKFFRKQSEIFEPMNQWGRKAQTQDQVFPHKGTSKRMADFPAFNKGSSQARAKQSVKWRKCLADFTDLYHCFPLFAWWKLQGLFSPDSTELNKLWHLWRREKKTCWRWLRAESVSVISHRVYRNSYCASKAPRLNGCFHDCGVL